MVLGSPFRYNQPVNFRKSTTSHEAWLSRQLGLVFADLARRHQAMREAFFPFLHATFDRWAQLWPKVCPECPDAPSLLAIGDLHVDNFGIWRDVEDRLVWASMTLIT
jgi:uncharacterized protein (DUF2252 family)